MKAETVAVVEELDEAVGRLAGLDVAGLPVGELAGLLGEVLRVRARVDGQVARITAAAASGGAHRDEGAPSAAAWLASRFRLGPREAQRQVRDAENLAALPAARAALEDGEISAEHARVLAAAADTTPPDDPAAGEAEDVRRVGLARRLDPEALRRQLIRDRHRNDPDGSAADEAARHAARRASLTQLPDGMWRVEGLLDTTGGETLKTALDALSAPEPASVPDALRRTAGQRCADALVRLAERALAAGELGTRGGGLRPHVTVTVGWDTLAAAAAVAAGAAAGEAGWSGPVSGETARRWACDAGVSRVIIGPDSAPLDVGRERYVVPAPLRRALVARDRECVGCHRPAGWCQSHHIRHWSDRGETRLDNLVLLCTACHHLMHEGGWQIRLVTGGAVLTGPDGREHHRPRPDHTTTGPPATGPPGTGPSATGPPTGGNPGAPQAIGPPLFRSTARAGPSPGSGMRPPDRRPPAAPASRRPARMAAQTAMEL